MDISKFNMDVSKFNNCLYKLVSEVIPNKLYFGGYPSEELFDWMVSKKGFTHFIDLTTEEERNSLDFVYDKTVEIDIIKFSIKDNSVPTDLRNFKELLRETHRLIEKDNSKIYIHCKGGHGRSGLMIACMLVYIYRIPVNKSLGLTTLYHSMRSHLKDKWKYAKCPQTYRQRAYVCGFMDMV